MKRNLVLLVSVLALVSGLLGLSASTASAGVKNSSKPTIFGEARLNVTLTANRGSWQYVAPPHQFVQYNFQWLKDGVAIPGATQKTFTPRDNYNPIGGQMTPSDVGSRISVRVTAVWRPAGRLGSLQSATAESAPTSPVAPGHMSAGNPSISGPNKVGATVELDEGLWNPYHTFEVRWLAVGGRSPATVLHTCGWNNAIWAHLCKRFVIPSSAVGKKLVAEVTGSAPSYLPKTRTATKLGFVQPAGAIS